MGGASTAEGPSHPYRALSSQYRWDRAPRGWQETGEGVEVPCLSPPPACRHAAKHVPCGVHNGLVLEGEGNAPNCPRSFLCKFHTIPDLIYQ